MKLRRRSRGKDARERAKVKRPCAVRGCPRLRTSVSSFCGTHGRNNTLFGHPTARRIHKYQWGGHAKRTSGYLKAVRELFKRNKGHDALVAADEFMAQLLTPGPERLPKRNGPGAAEYHLQVELTRLQKAGVAPRAALEVAVAVWLLSLEQPATLPDDVRLTKALGDAVLRTAKLRRLETWIGGKRRVRQLRPAGGALTLLGTKIRENLGVLVFHVEKLITEHRQTINEELATRKEEQQEKSRPFRVLIRKPADTTETLEVPLHTISLAR